MESSAVFSGFMNYLQCVDQATTPDEVGGGRYFQTCLAVDAELILPLRAVVHMC
jgi:hypothetical protein